MTILWPYLLVALVLLWCPRSWLRFGKSFLRRRRRGKAGEPWRDRDASDHRILFRQEFTKLRNYIDLLRAVAGSLAIYGSTHLPAAIAASASAPRVTVIEVAAIRAAILLVGLVLQTTRYQKGRLAFYPPIFYLAGLSVALCDPRGAAFAFILIWALNSGLPNAQAMLSVYALLLVVFGHFFAWRGDLAAVFAGILCFLPVLLSLMARRPLVIFTRKASHST